MRCEIKASNVMEVLFLLYKISLWWALTMLVVQVMFYCPLEVPQAQFLKHHPMTLKSVSERSDNNMIWMMCLHNSEMWGTFWLYTIVKNAYM